MPLPENLTSYEFARQILPITHIKNFYHLKTTYENKLPKIIDSPQAHHESLSQLKFANQEAPFEVEIGCGKGSFMIEYCQLNPSHNFMAIDLDMGIAAYSAKRAAKRKALMNTRIFCADAFYLFRDFMPDNCIDAFHMYFPDPWPKKRHTKRRLLTEKYLQQVKRIAKPNALFHWATDFQKYHESACETFANFSGIELVEKEAKPILNLTTNFEKKYIKEGRPIYRSIFKID